MPRCGNGLCEPDHGENCGTCPADCGCGVNGFCFEKQCYTKTRPVAPTNQTTCYDVRDDKPIPCPGTAGTPQCATTPLCGQDAQYPDNPRKFQVQAINHDNVVSDSLTGLMWLQDAHHKEPTMNDASDYCKERGDAGFTDWRLPGVTELADIVNYGSAGPAIDNTAFPNTDPERFWTSTKFAGGHFYVWSIDFDAGKISHDNGVLADEIVRCVRLGSASTASQFIQREYVTGQGVVMDLSTGLMWTETSESGRTWQEALAYCEGLDYGGFNDWRLPNVNELRSLVNYNMSGPASDFPGIHSDRFWSSSSRVDRGHRAWLVDFDDGGTGDDGKKYTHHVRCVRLGP